MTTAASEYWHIIDGEKDTTAAHAQDSNSKLVKPTLSLSAALWREHRESTEPGTGKQPVCGASREVDALWSAESTLSPRDAKSPKENKVPVEARRLRYIYYLDQLVAGIVGAE